MKGRILGYLSAVILGATVPSVANGLIQTGGEYSYSCERFHGHPVWCYTDGADLVCQEFISNSEKETKYELIVRPEDTWESLVDNLMVYEPEITLDGLVTQALNNNPALGNLIPGEKLTYTVGK